jgi:hypothetical protein
LEEGVPCSCGCIIHTFGRNIISSREGDIDHPISFASRKLSTIENNYTTEMVYEL